MTDGIIIKGIGGFYYVATDIGTVECRARGKFHKMGIKPMVGDKVKVSVVNEASLEGAVEKIEDRKNSLVRPPVANIDCIVIVAAAMKPQPDYFMIDKLIITAEKRNIDIVIAVNKTDLKSPDELKSIYSASGYDVISVCANTGEGVDTLKNRIRGRITAFAGNSGVGKSSLLNHFGLDLQTGDISRIERGKHTTRHVELYKTDVDTYVMDTPGFSILDVSDIECDELKKYFREFRDLEDNCRFVDCNHFGVKASDCAIKEAVDKGIIPQSRYDNYIQLYTSLKEINKWEK